MNLKRYNHRSHVSTIPRMKRLIQLIYHWNELEEWKERHLARRNPKIKEIWKRINNYPSYAVSNNGRVKRIRPGQNTKIGRINKQWKMRDGYWMVSLFHEGQQKQVTVHSVVANAFLGLCPNGKEINHKDGNKDNNTPANLEYVTKSENCLHAFRLGLRSLKGEKHPAAKLTNNDVLLIRQLSKKMSHTAIAKIFGISRRNISYIVNRTAWPHLY